MLLSNFAHLIKDVVLAYLMQTVPVPRRRRRPRLFQEDQLVSFPNMSADVLEIRIAGIALLDLVVVSPLMLVLVPESLPQYAKSV